MLIHFNLVEVKNIECIYVFVVVFFRKNLYFTFVFQMLHIFFFYSINYMVISYTFVLILYIILDLKIEY